MGVNAVLDQLNVTGFISAEDKDRPDFLVGHIEMAGRVHSDPVRLDQLKGHTEHFIVCLCTSQAVHPLVLFLDIALEIALLLVRKIPVCIFDAGDGGWIGPHDKRIIDGFYNGSVVFLFLFARLRREGIGGQHRQSCEYSQRSTESTEFVVLLCIAASPESCVYRWSDPCDTACKTARCFPDRRQQVRVRGSVRLVARRAD